MEWLRIPDHLRRDYTGQGDLFSQSETQAELDMDLEELFKQAVTGERDEQANIDTDGI